MKLRTRTGLTLTEIMVATMIFTFIIGGMYMTLMVGKASWQSYDATVRSQQEVRKAILAMTRDFRIAQNIVLVQDANNVSLTFTQDGVGSISYTWSTGGSSANQILRVLGANTRIIAQDISAFVVTDTPDNMTFDLTSTIVSPSGHSDTFQLAKRVAKR